MKFVHMTCVLVIFVQHTHRTHVCRQVPVRSLTLHTLIYEQELYDNMTISEVSAYWYNYS